MTTAPTRALSGHVLVTGSRTFPWPNRVYFALNHYAFSTLEWRERNPLWRMKVTDGACETGTDLFSRQWCEETHFSFVDHNPMPADWAKFKRGAGPERNERMVRQDDPPVDHAFVFMNEGYTGPLNRGTRDCLRRIHQHVIPHTVTMTDAWGFIYTAECIPLTAPAPGCPFFDGRERG